MSPATTRALRTVLQTAVGIAFALPALVDTGALPRSLPWVAGALAVSGLLARLMAVPAVQALLPAWLTAPAGPASASPGDAKAQSTAAPAIRDAHDAD